MSQVRRLQRKGNLRYISVPRVFCEMLSLQRGQHMMIHAVNNRQLILTKLEEDLPVIQLEKERS